MSLEVQRYVEAALGYAPSVVRAAVLGHSGHALLRACGIVHLAPCRYRSDGPLCLRLVDRVGLLPVTPWLRVRSADPWSGMLVLASLVEPDEPPRADREHLLALTSVLLGEGYVLVVEEPTP